MDIRAFNILSLCSGGGGLELGLRIAVPGSGVACYVEREAFDCALLVKRMQEGILDDAPIWSDLKTFDPKPWRGKVHCVTAGYPCQPESVAGHRLGKDDPRWLWPWVRDVVEEVAPIFVFCENVEGHLKQGFRQVAEDLHGMGYGVEVGLFSAREVGATHCRRRLFILGYSQGRGDEAGEPPEGGKGEAGKPCGGMVEGDALNGPAEGRKSLFPPGRRSLKTWHSILGEQVHAEPVIPRMDDELAPWVDGYKEGHDCRLYALGNGVVPTCAGYAFLVLVSRMLGGEDGHGVSSDNV